MPSCSPALRRQVAERTWSAPPGSRARLPTGARPRDPVIPDALRSLSPPLLAVSAKLIPESNRERLGQLASTTAA